jgi:hypothetical protein
LFSGDIQRADECFLEQLLTASTIGHEPGIGYALEGLFATAAKVGNIERAGQLLGAAEAIRRRKGNAAATMLTFHSAQLQEIEQSPHVAQFEKARSAGRLLDPAAAVEMALNQAGPMNSDN